MTNRVVTLHLIDHVAELIDFHADATGMTKSQVVANAIVQTYSSPSIASIQGSLFVLQEQIYEILKKLEQQEDDKT